MEGLSKILYTTVSSAVNEFIDVIVEEFSLDKDAVVDVWNRKVSPEVRVTATSSAKAPVKRAPRAKAEVADTGSKKTCQYAYVKGAKEGEYCGAKVSDDSASGNFCKKHLSHENSKEEKGASKRAPKKVTGKKAEAKEERTDVVAAVKASAPTVSIKMNERRRYQHEGTGLLFDRSSKEVYGREDASGNVVPLTAEDIILCKKYGFRYQAPENLTSAADKEDVEVEDDEDDEEEVDEDEDEEDEDE